MVPQPMTEPSKFSSADYDRAHDAYGEYKTKGSTRLTCLHCGHGQFQFMERGNSVEIRCNTAGCLVERIRGI